MTSIGPKVDVLGTAISVMSVDQVANLLAESPGEGRTVAICNVHSVMTARHNAALRSALAEVDIATADGMPLVWALRALGEPDQTRCTGIDVMLRTIEIGLDSRLSHFLYGSTPATLASLEATLRDRYPSVVIAGVLSPPFQPFTEREQEEHIRQIRDSGAQLVWVGLGMPKQELWMAGVRHRLHGISLVGVGAAFDWLAASVPRAPEWMRDAGLEWLYRLAKEPRRLWRRYIFNNPAYLALLGVAIIRRKLGYRPD